MSTTRGSVLYDFPLTVERLQPVKANVARGQYVSVLRCDTPATLRVGSRGRGFPARPGTVFFADDDVYVQNVTSSYQYYTETAPPVTTAGFPSNGNLPAGALLLSVANEQSKLSHILADSHPWSGRSLGESASPAGAAGTLWIEPPTVDTYIFLTGISARYSAAPAAAVAILSEAPRSDAGGAQAVRTFEFEPATFYGGKLYVEFPRPIYLRRDHYARLDVAGGGGAVISQYRLYGGMLFD